MSNTPHTLADEFPGAGEAISKLKVADPDFARLLARYDEVNDQVHLAETNIAPVDLGNYEIGSSRHLQLIADGFTIASVNVV